MTKARGEALGLLTYPWILGLALPLLAAAGAAAAFTIDATVAKRLAAGEVLISVGPDETGSAALIDAVIDVPVPRRSLWTTMLDCDRMKRVVGGLESCKVLERDPQGRWDIREHVINWGWLLPNLRSVFRSEYTGDEKIAFRRIEGDLTVLDGYLRLDQLDGGKRTRLFYKNKIGTSLPLPGFMVRDSLEKDIPETLRQLRAEAIRAAKE